MHCAPFLLTMQIIFASVSYRRVVADLRNIESDEVKEIRRELFEETSTRADDAVKLRKDMEHIRSDVRVSFNKLILGNG